MGRWHEAAGAYGGAVVQGTAEAAGLVPAHTAADYLSQPFGPGIPNYFLPDHGTFDRIQKIKVCF